MENPGEESGAERGLCGEKELGVIDQPGFGFLSEVVQDGIHGILVAKEGNFGAFAVEELESFFAEIRNAVAFGLLHGSVIEKLGRLGNPVNPEGSDLLMLVGPAHHVIAIAVPGQGIGTEDIGLAAVLEALSLGGRPGEIEERDLPLFVDGLVDDVDILVDMLVPGLDPLRQRNVSLQVSRLVDVGHGSQLVRQDLALGSGYKLGGGHGVDQKLELSLLEGPFAQIVFVLRGVDRLHIVAGHFQGFHVPSDGDAEGVDVPALLQEPDAFRRGDGVLGVTVRLQELQQPQQPDPALVLFPGGQFCLVHSAPPKIHLVQNIILHFSTKCKPYLIIFCLGS